MVFIVVDQLSGAERVHQVELNASRQLLPLEVEKFVEVTGLHPPLMSQRHASPHHIAIVTWHDRVLVL